MKRFKTIIFIMLLMLFAVPFKVLAANNITFSVGGTTVKQGQTFSITVSQDGASSQYTLYSFNFNVEFDGSIIEFTGGEGKNGASVSQNGNSITISSNKQISDKGEVAVLNFKANKDGQSNLKVTNQSCSINGESSSCTFNGSTVKVNSLGTDSTLSGLSIPNTTLSPAFNKNNKEYSANLKDVTSIEVKATASDPNASIQISDNYRNLQKGENTITVQVTSENGKNKTKYTIKVNLELTPTEEELRVANASLSVLEIKGQKIDFNKEEVKYYLDVPYSVKALEITATPENEAAQVQISGADKLIVGKNTVNIVVTAEDTTTTKTYSLVVTRLQENKKIVPTCPDTTSVKEWIIFSVGLFLTFTLGIVLGYILCKKDILNKIFKKKDKEEEPVEIQTLSDTIDLSEVVEEIKDEEDVKKA